MRTRWCLPNPDDLIINASYAKCEILDIIQRVVGSAKEECWEWPSLTSKKEEERFWRDNTYPGETARWEKLCITKDIVCVIITRTSMHNPYYQSSVFITRCKIKLLSGTSKLKNLAGVLGVQILYTVFMYLKVVWYIGQVK